MLRIENNPDFFSALPKQTAQGVVKLAASDFQNWLRALKEYARSPEKFLGKPGMPHYKKSLLSTFPVTNQDAVLYPADSAGNYGVYLKFPLTKERIFLSHIAKTAALKEVKIIPYYGRFILALTIETEEILPNAEKPNAAAVDFGVDNIAAIVCTDETSRLYKGGAVLSSNRLFAKKRAAAIGILTKGHENMFASSKYLDNLSFHHANFNKDQMHKISRSIVEYCLVHNVGTLVLGYNELWKQKANLGKQNNQTFTSVPHYLLKQLITYKANAAGINVILSEESFTSKADFLCGDFIPTYGDADAKKCVFSGRRIARGLYKSGCGKIVNADLNGAANILRKAIPYAFESIKGTAFLENPEVLGFHELNPKCISVKRIVGA